MKKSYFRIAFNTCALFLLTGFSWIFSAPNKVSVVKNEKGHWELQVNGTPYYVKGSLYTPVALGEDPSTATMGDWMQYDLNKNHKNDLLEEVWLDRNRNNLKDSDEKMVGDFQILKDLGCNTLRLYHLPSAQTILGKIYKTNPGTKKQFDHESNKELLRTIHQKFGMRFLLGNYLGSWTIGSGTTWEEGTDYNNPQHLQNIENSLKALILDHKDEAYVLAWVLGNENNIATWSKCNAAQEKIAYYQFVNRMAQKIHEWDPQHPVMICEGFTENDLPYYSKYLPDIDIFGFNAYMGWGFNQLWDEFRAQVDKPVCLTEFGLFSFQSGQINEKSQATYLKACLEDMWKHSALNQDAKDPSARICVGGTLFDYLDRWYMNGNPKHQNSGSNRWEFSDDNIEHSEYWGITSMGDGKDGLFKRQLKQACDVVKNHWTSAQAS